MPVMKACTWLTRRFGKLLCIKDKRNTGSIREARGRQGPQLIYGRLGILFSGLSRFVRGWQDKFSEIFAGIIIVTI